MTTTAIRTYYLDAPEEKGSLCILRELQITVSVSLSLSSTIERADGITLSRSHPSSRERKSLSKLSYSILQGEIYVDVRDSGDCWLRICLSAGQTITLPPHLYHKLSHEAIHEVKIAIDVVDNSEINYLLRFPEEIDSFKLVPRHTFRELICELCSQFYDAGWVTGTGGSISIRYGNRIFMTPSGVQKERILPDELFMLDIDGHHLSVPPQKSLRPPKLSDCSPLFLHAYRLRNAGAVLHSHDITCVLVTAITTTNEYRISHQEMIKGIAGYGYHDELIIPIIENTAWESELADSMERAIVLYPRAVAVLVRDHGIYVWGDSWEQAKRHGECLHYLFNVSIQKHQLNISPIYSHLVTSPTEAGQLEGGDTDEEGQRKRKRSQNQSGLHPEHSSPFESLIHKCCHLCNQKKSNSPPGYASGYKYIVCDIEGTTTPITFVKDVLFPYARDHALNHLRSTWNQTSTQQDILSLLSQAQEDISKFQQGDHSLSPLPSWLPNMLDLSANLSSSHLDEELLQYLNQYVHWCIQLDRKISSLKNLQGKIWRNGYESGNLKSIVYDEILSFFSRMKNMGAQICIYSSGSREAQKLLFQYSNHGDLRPFLSCYFDTSIGHKRQADSYRQIFLSLGANRPEEILFLTDIIEEAYAAKEAGIQAVLSDRPGNAPFPSSHPFPIVKTFDLL